jgi:sterol 3beta-glucosyltransferase
MTLPVINQLRQEILELPPVPWSYYSEIDVSEVPILYGYSQYVLPIPADWGAQLHVTGYWFLPDMDYQPPGELSAFLEQGPKPVYIGFGSMLDVEAARTTQIVLEALEMTGQRAILHGGWSKLGAMDLPANVLRIGDVPHSWLFPRVAAVVHHGGAGTTAAGLRAGVPAVIVPYFGDQPFWARVVHRMGASPTPIPRLKLSAGKLADALQEATRDQTIQKASSRLGTRIQAERGVQNAVELINQYLSRPESLLQYNP